MHEITSTSTYNKARGKNHMFLMNLVGDLLGLPFVVDGLIVLFLLWAFFIGWVRGFWWSLWRLTFLVLLLGISYAVLLTPFVEFLNVGMWETFNLSFTMTLGGIEYTITSPQDYFTGVLFYANNFEGGYLDGASLLNDPAYVSAFTLAVLELVGFLVLVLINFLLSWILTDILYGVWGRKLFGSLRKLPLRPLAGVVGLVQGSLYVLLFAIVLSPLAATAAEIDNYEFGPYKFNPLYGDIITGLAPENSAILDLLDTQANSYRNPFNLFDDLLNFEFDGTSFSLVEQMQEYINQTDAPNS
jgi:hypothetical protein